MKYLILLTLLLIGCNSTMEVCEEYETSYILTVKLNDNVDHTKYSSPEECMDKVDEYKVKDISAACSKVIDNTGCN